MSSPPGVRRVDRLMAQDKAREFLKAGFDGRLATVSEDGSPYCLPLLYVWMDDRLFFHNTIARGHLRANVDHERRICFLVDEPEQVFDYGRFECDTGLADRRVMVFGTIEIIEDFSLKQQFFEVLLDKYGTPDRDRPRGFFPRIGEVTVYAISIERITGKELTLPAVSERWPAVDRSKSPNARPPEAGFTRG
jgi:nitroimidazol reductase NimA-like FMN-containing flavoprotein (pyridoxamine 5'-phosphate oxidase superfamily)